MFCLQNKQKQNIPAQNFFIRACAYHFDGSYFFAIGKTILFITQSGVCISR